MSAPCLCWAKALLHEGHCCFRNLPPGATTLQCDHYNDGMDMLRAAKEGTTT